MGEATEDKAAKPGEGAKAGDKWVCECWDQSCQSMFSDLHGEGVTTIMDRSAAQGAQCKFGSLGLCCRICLQGPCRINPMGKEPTTGICGARDYTIVARYIDRMIAGGTASHSAHGKEIAHVLLGVAEGKIKDYKVTDAAKLESVAKKLGIPYQGKAANVLAGEVARAAMEDYSRYDGQPLTFLRSTVTKGRMKTWDFNGVVPSNIETAITNVIHRTAMGVDADPVPILFGGIQCALSD